MQDYTGLGAIGWKLYADEPPDHDHSYFQAVIASAPGPALDVGCGTGRLLVPFLGAGLDVEGIDSSKEMLDICRRRAQERGLSPTLYHQAMENLESMRRYGCIIVPCGSIQLVVERAAAQEALVRFRRHLRPGGVLILTVFNRWHEIKTERLGEWVQRFDRLLPDGARLVKHSKVESRDDTDQLLECTVRYRRVRDGAVVEEQVCVTPERWFTRNEMCLMLEIAGFSEVSVTGDFSDEAAADTHETFVFNAQ